MYIFFPIIKILAGIGLFLFAMYLIEDALKNLSGRRFKLFLQRIAKNNASAAAGGAFVTAILQSSSMVSFMVLAFVGTGVFTLTNAMAIILGANLGSTFTSWIIVTLGFKVNIEAVAYPAVFIGGILLILYNSKTHLKYTAYFLLGFGLLFIGLAFMKTAMEEQVQMIDLRQYRDFPLVLFLLIGFIVTLLVQSSSVTMALTLTALYTGAIEFFPAAAIALGAETGTTLKIMLGALDGHADKKRVALGNILFNLTITVLAFTFLSPLLHFITDTMHVKDPLLGLVVFSSFINLGAILLFLPVIKPFTALLTKLIANTDPGVSAYISHAYLQDTHGSLQLMRNEIAYLIHNTLLHNLNCMEIENTWWQQQASFKELNRERNFDNLSNEEAYVHLKKHQGEIQSFYILMRHRIKPKMLNDLNQITAAARGAMHSAKSMRDVAANIKNLSKSSKDLKYNLFAQQKEKTKNIYLELIALLNSEAAIDHAMIHTIFEEIQNNYTATLNDFYKQAQTTSLDVLDITTAINFNRELFTSHKAILMAVKDFLLTEKDAVHFNHIVYQS